MADIRTVEELLTDVIEKSKTLGRAKNTTNRANIQSEIGDLINKLKSKIGKQEMAIGEDELGRITKENKDMKQEIEKLLNKISSKRIGLSANDFIRNNIEPTMKKIHIELGKENQVKLDELYNQMIEFGPDEGEGETVGLYFDTLYEKVAQKVNSITEGRRLVITKKMVYDKLRPLISNTKMFDDIMNSIAGEEISLEKLLEIVKLFVNDKIAHLIVFSLFITLGGSIVGLSMNKELLDTYIKKNTEGKKTKKK